MYSEETNQTGNPDYQPTHLIHYTPKKAKVNATF